MSERELHRIRKIAEVYEDALRIRLPTGSLYRVIRTAGTMTSIGGIFIALSGLNDAAGSIEETVRQKGERSVEPDEINDFYLASGVFIGELVLLATPFPGNLAFKTTGRLHSRLLWHRFRRNRAEYRLLLHHIYYFIKGVPSLVLHNVQDGIDTIGEFVDSIVFLVRTSWEAFEEPAVIGDIRSFDLDFVVRSLVTDLSTEAIEDQLGDLWIRLESYVKGVLDDIRGSYDDLYKLLGVDGINDVIEQIVDRLAETYVTG